MAWDPVDAAKAQLARLRRTLRSIDARDAKVATGAACVGLGLGMLMAGARDRRALRRLTAVVKTAEADADAARRTAARDVAEAKRFGAQKVAASFFGVADSLALARQSSADTAAYDALDAQLHAALAANNVTPFAPEPGDAFDPATMEALRALAPPSGPPVVAEVLQCGYTMHDRVVRAAAVVTRDAEESSSSS
jgi:molecular chaperone GrpE (heat shock protein)